MKVHTTATCVVYLFFVSIHPNYMQVLICIHHHYCYCSWSMKFDLTFVWKCILCLLMFPLNNKSGLMLRTLYMPLMHTRTRFLPIIWHLGTLGILEEAPFSTPVKIPYITLPPSCTFLKKTCPICT
jgi:hypothetical protein